MTVFAAYAFMSVRLFIFTFIHFDLHVTHFLLDLCIWSFTISSCAITLVGTRFVSWANSLQIFVDYFIHFILRFLLFCLLIGNNLDNFNLVWQNRHTNESIRLSVMTLLFRASNNYNILYNLLLRISRHWNWWILPFRLKYLFIMMSPNRSHGYRHRFTILIDTLLASKALRCILMVM